MNRPVELSRARVGLALLLALVWLVGLGSYPLLESTEGRYASVAVEMLRRGDYLDPRLDGLLHFDKPPLTYWLGALSAWLLGANEFALRLVATLVWLLCGALTYRIARGAGLDRRRAAWAVAFGCLAPLAVVQARMLTSDLLVWAAILGTYAALLDDAGDRRRRAFLIGASWGVGMLAKGHIVLFWTVPPVLLDAALCRTRRRLALLFHPIAIVGLLCIGLSWFIVEVVRHPPLLGFWLGRETAGRVLGKMHGRHEPWWYFVVILPAMVLPWLPEIVRGVALGLRRARARLGAWPLLFGWFALLLLLLSAVSSKRSNYLLPMLTPLGVMAAAAMGERAGRGLRMRTGVWIVICVMVPYVLAVVPSFVPPTRALMEQAHRHGGPLVSFRIMPTSMPFYRGADVPVVEAGHMSAVDDSVETELWAPPRPDTLATVVSAGGLILAREQDVPLVEGLVGRPLQAIASRRGQTLLSAAP